MPSAARDSLRELGIDNADIVEGPLGAGFAEGAPYDVIVLNGSVPEVPESLFAQLKEGGRLAAILSAARESGKPGQGISLRQSGRAS